MMILEVTYMELILVIVVNIFCVGVGIGFRLISIRISWCAKKITDRRIKKNLDKDASSNSLPKIYQRKAPESTGGRSASTDPQLIAALKSSFPEVSRLNPSTLCVILFSF